MYEEPCNWLPYSGNGVQLYAMIQYKFLAQINSFLINFAITILMMLHNNIISDKI